MVQWEFFLIRGCLSAAEGGFATGGGAALRFVF